MPWTLREKSSFFGGAECHKGTEWSLLTTHVRNVFEFLGPGSGMMLQKK